MVRRERYVSTEGVMWDIVYSGGRDGAVMIISVLGKGMREGGGDWMVGLRVDMLFRL